MSKLFTNCLERKVHTLSEMDDKIGMSKAIRSTRPAPIFPVWVRCSPLWD